MPQPSNVFELPQDEEEELEEGEEEDEAEEEEEEEEEVPPTPAPRVAARVAAPAAPAPKPQRTNKKTRKGSKADAAATRFPTEPVWQERDVELLWPEILSTLGKPGSYYESRSAYDVEVRALRLEPPPKLMVGRFEGSLCVGDATINPGDAFIETFDDWITLPANMTTSVRFDVQFVWKGGPEAGKCFARGIMARPSAMEVYRMRAARQREGVRRNNMSGQGQGQEPGFGAAQGMPPMPQPAYPQGLGYAPLGQPQGPYGYGPQGPYGYQPAYPYPQPGYPQPYGYPQPPQEQQLSPAVQQLVSTLTEQLNITRKELAESRGQPAPPPVQVPVGVGAAPPPVPEDLDTRIARGVVSALRAVGLGAIQPGAPNPANTIADKLMSASMSMLEGIVTETSKRVAGGIQNSIRAQSMAAGEPEPPPDLGVSHEAIPVEKENPTDSLPFQQVTLEGRWQNGQQVVYTPAKEGQSSLMGVHPMGFITANPFVLEKLTEAASAGLGRIVDTVADAAQRMTAGGAPHVVHRTPSGAVDASPEAPPPPPPPPTEGGGSGWPTG